MTEVNGSAIIMHVARTNLKIPLSSKLKVLLIWLFPSLTFNFKKHSFNTTLKVCVFL